MTSSTFSITHHQCALVFRLDLQKNRATKVFAREKFGLKPEAAEVELYRKMDVSSAGDYKVS